MSGGRLTDARLASQVAALRAELADLCIAPNSGGYWTCECCGATTPEVSPKHNPKCLITDTEAAAREHDQRLRLEGAREYYERLGTAIAWDGDTADLIGDVLADMEADHASR